jgi:hypothetical protein
MPSGLYDINPWFNAVGASFVSIEFEIYVLTPCIFSGYTFSSNVMTGKTFNYERSQGSTSYNFDTISGTTGSSCIYYTQWTYYLSASSGVDISTIGMTVDNSVDPAILVVNGADSGPATTTLTMTWYALADIYTSHSQITQTFTWVMYTALLGVTSTGLDASPYTFYIGMSG